MNSASNFQTSESEELAVKFSSENQNYMFSTSCPAQLSHLPDDTWSKPIAINKAPPRLTNALQNYSGFSESLPSDFHRVEHDGIENLLEKQRRRRESHNAVERRRRDHINEMIQRLNIIVPEMADDGYGLDSSKSNKGEILSKTVEYIQNLQYAYDKALSFILKIDPHWHPDK